MQNLLARVVVVMAFFTSGAYGVLAQPDTEIYLFDLIKEGDQYRIENPVSITLGNPGYDNQPYFTPDGESLLYVSTRNGQTDIAELELRDYSRDWLTNTAGSEYSPAPIPGKNAFSSILLEKDGTQLLREYPLDLIKPNVLVPDLKIGYHCWFNDETIVAFVLGEPPTLQVCNFVDSTNRVLAKNIGRSLHRIPQQELISYISKEKDTWWIKSMDPNTGITKNIIATFAGVEDLAWAPDGTIFMGKDDRLFKFRGPTDHDWEEVGSLGKHNLKGITRLAVSPKGDKIALVVAQ